MGGVECTSSCTLCGGGEVMANGICWSQDISHPACTVNGVGEHSVVSNTSFGCDGGVFEVSFDEILCSDGQSNSIFKEYTY